MVRSPYKVNHKKYIKSFIDFIHTYTVYRYMCACVCACVRASHSILMTQT